MLSFTSNLSGGAQRLVLLNWKLAVINNLTMTTVSAQVHDSLVFSRRWNQPLQVACKRILDIIGSSLLLTVLSPLFLLLAVMVKLTSVGPVLYHWKVMGRNGRPFTGYKFRSMVVNADQLKDQLKELNEMSGPMFKLSRDPRVTSVGSWMRRYSLDELPQLYSVLKGDMSLVGPRPPLVTEYAEFTNYQKQKLAVKPGITCLWQVNGRNQINDFDEWIRLDLQYIGAWSLGLDLKILFKTLRAVFAGSGK
jgi:lipopolysaccharide/colanic/teichoic acid biosynthesis glycosyltransferase